MRELPSWLAVPADPALIPRALDVAGKLANDAADVIMATAGRVGKSSTQQTDERCPGWTQSPFDWADPFRAQIYAAARGRGARANGLALRVPAPDRAGGGLVCTELTRTGPWPGMGAFAQRAALAGSGIRVLGCAALAVIQVALGHAVAAVLHGYREWDVAASVGLAVESGAVVLDRHGAAGGLPTDGLLVAAPTVAEELHGWWTDALAHP